MSVKDHEESFGTHQFARELSLWSLSYRSSKIDTGRQGGDSPWTVTVPHTAIVILPYLRGGGGGGGVFDSPEKTPTISGSGRGGMLLLTGTIA